VPSGPSLCSIKRASEDDLGIPLQSGGRTLRHGKDSGSVATTFLLAKLRQDVSKYIWSCTACTISKPTTKKQGMYTPLPTPDRPWESISMDYMSGLPSTKRGNDCVFVVVDHFSKMVIMATCKKSITVEATAKIFFERVWVHFGIPQTIISYQDSQFLNTFWSSLWSLLDTKLTKSTSFHPQTDGQTEVVNQMIMHILHVQFQAPPHLG
jgi:hypothetical protein